MKSKFSKIIAVLLIIITCVSITGCGKKEEEDKKSRQILKKQKN